MDVVCGLYVIVLEVACGLDIAALEEVFALCIFVKVACGVDIAALKVVLEVACELDIAALEVVLEVAFVLDIAALDVAFGLCIVGVPFSRTQSDLFDGLVSIFSILMLNVFQIHKENLYISCMTKMLEATSARHSGCLK